MIKNALSKVMWVGRATVFLVGLAVILALVVGLTSAAFGANGDAFRLGQGNVATKLTSLGGTLGVNGPMLKVANKNGGTDDTALRLEVDPQEAPMSVNSTTKVNGFNADQVDGRDAAQFVTTNTYRKETALGPGTQQADGGYVQTALCDAGDVLLSGGPANVHPPTAMVESFANNGGGWSVKVDKHGSVNDFSVVVVCANNQQ
jgi:hypothetical protein